MTTAEGPDEAGDVARPPEAERLLHELKTLAHGGGYAAPDELARFRSALRTLNGIDLGPWRGYIREKLSSAEGYAEILFSGRKHERYANDAQTGARSVRSMIAADLDASGRNMFASSPNGA